MLITTNGFALEKASSPFPTRLSCSSLLVSLGLRRHGPFFPLLRSLYTLYKFQPEYFLFTCTCYWTRELPITSDNCVTFRREPPCAQPLSRASASPLLHPPFPWSFFLRCTAPPFARPFLPLIFLISHDIGPHKLSPPFDIVFRFSRNPPAPLSPMLFPTHCLVRLVFVLSGEISETVLSLDKKMERIN